MSLLWQRVRPVLGRARSRGRSLYRRARFPQGALLECEGISVHCDFHHPSHVWYGGASPNLRLDRQVLASLVPQAAGSIYFDIGAHWGWFTQAIRVELRTHALRGRIVAVEVDHAHLDSLHRTVAAGDADDGIEIDVEHAGIGAADGFTTLFRDSSRCAFTYPTGTAAGEQVRLRSMDSLAEQYCGPSDRIALIKVDVDGAEPAFIAGAGRTISAHRPIVFMEFAPANLQESGTDPGAFLRSLVADFHVLRVRYDTLTVTRVTRSDVGQVVADTTGRIADLVLATRPIELPLP